MILFVIYPFKVIEIPHCYQRNQSISVERIFTVCQSIQYKKGLMVQGDVPLTFTSSAHLVCSVALEADLYKTQQETTNQKIKSQMDR